MHVLFIAQDPSIRSLYFCSDMEIKNKAWQVMELEEFRINILQENQLLKERVSSLHLQIKELEESVSSAHASTEITKVCFLHPLFPGHVLNLLILVHC